MGLVEEPVVKSLHGKYGATFSPMTNPQTNKEETFVDNEIAKFKELLPASLITGGGSGYEAAQMQETMDKWWEIVWQILDPILRKSLVAAVEHGREEAAHKTEDGYCCACDYDIARFQSQLHDLMEKIEGKKKESYDGIVLANGVAREMIMENRAHNSALDSILKVLKPLLDNT